jgi:hypothetical protein
MPFPAQPEPDLASTDRLGRASPEPFAPHLSDLGPPNGRRDTIPKGRPRIERSALGLWLRYGLGGVPLANHLIAERPIGAQMSSAPMRDRPFAAAPKLGDWSSKRGCSPSEKKAHVARHAAREIHDLGAQLVALRLELLLPELVGDLGEAGQALWPIGLEAVDRPTPSVQYSLEKRSVRTSRSPRSAVARTTLETRSNTSG